MIWNPPFNATVTTLLVVAAIVVMALTFLWSRKHLDVLTPEGLATVGLRSLGFLLVLYFLLQPSRLPTPERVITPRTLAVLIDSSGSMSEPARYGSPASRLQVARESIEQRRVFPQITEDATLAIYTFAEQVVSVRADAIADIQATGRATDLTATLEQVRRLHQNDDLTGVLMFTDARNTQGTDPREVAERLGVPVYGVVLGEPRRDDSDADEPRRDLAIEAVNAQPRIVLGRTGQVAVSVRASGYPARQVRVELLENNQVIGSTTVAVDSQQSRRQALFSIRPNRIGQHTYEVRIPIEADEVDTTNNLSTFNVEVIDPVNRLLYLDRLRQERSFLRRVIDGQRNLRYAAVAQIDEDRVWIDANDDDMRAEGAALTTQQLRQTKAVVIGDIPAATFSQEQIDALVQWVDEGGALLLLAGPESMGANGFGATDMRHLLPVNLSGETRYMEGEFPVRLTPDGAAHPIFQQVRDQWQHAPPLLSRFAVTSVKPAATTLLATDDMAAAPIMVSQNYGHGKVAVVLTDSTWRWQLGFDPSRAQRGEGSQHELLWKQLIDWAMPELTDQPTGEVQVQVIADRVSYEVGDVVTLIASVRDAAGQTPPNASVQFTIAAPDGRPITREATLQSLTGGEEDRAFVASFDTFFPGRYQVQAVARVDNRTLGADQYEVQVIQPLLEFVNTDPDPALMRELTRLTGGAYLEAVDLDRLASMIELQPREVTIQPNTARDARPAWDRWWLMLAFVTLMGGEWFIRRRNQWV